MDILRADHLVKSFRSRTVVDDVSINVQSGEVVGLLGPNGAGKTTSFYMMVGLIPVNKGNILLNDRDITHLPMHSRARLGIGYLPQEASVFRKLTVSENIMAILETRPELDKKQRHEVRRKLRRLWGVDDVHYRCHEVTSQDVSGLTDTFLKLFLLSREEKAGFMTSQMETFFHSIAQAMTEIKLLRYGILEVESQITAMIMGFDYNQALYLYNSAFDPQYNSLSVGLLSKVLCIKESIALGRRKWDFLKGAEKYKYQLGGSEVKLYHCRIMIG